MERSNTDIRLARLEDAAELCRLLNAVIEQGGTTAMETPLSVARFANYFLRGPQCICCFVAEDRRDRSLLGFQALEHHDELPDDWGDIDTFARIQSKVRGVGSALFPATRNLAIERKLVAINATIRADNQGGLRYYTKMGFEDYSIAKGVKLKDGTRVDRLSKRYLLARA